jgi:arginase family enzyme
MGVAHMLDLPGCVPELAGIGSRRPLLGTLVADPRVVGMSIVEANPDHDPDGTSIRRLLTVIAGALAAAD